MDKYMNPFYKFSFILIIVTFFCDLGLNFLSRQSQSLVPRSIKALKSYFDYYNNIALTGIYASITVLICYLITAEIVYLLFNLSVPNNIKQLFLFLIVAFFVGYKVDGIFTATLYTLVATIGSTAITLLLRQKVSKVHLITNALLLVSASLTLFSGNTTFIKMKPTILYCIFGFAFLITNFKYYNI